jgi:MFS family permease
MLANRRAVSLLGCLCVQRVAKAAFPVVLVVQSVTVRGYAAAALIQGVYVAVGTFSAPLRGRLLDRVGRHRVIVPQTLLVSFLLIGFTMALANRSTPLALLLVAAVGAAAASPSTDAAIRTLWRTIGTDEHQVKALHAWDSILEEVGFLVGPALASVLMLTAGQTTALYGIVTATICGGGLVLLSRELRSALRTRPSEPSAPITVRPARARRVLRTLVGPIASRELQRIVLPLILMGSVFGVVGLLAPALCAAHGRSEDAGFLLAAISLGGVIGALGYGALKLRWSLHTRHAALGLVFSVPLLFALLADNPWALGILLVIVGLAVTPLYINAYLMMDADIPDAAIHEANTWVPVGNNVGYITGITIAASLLGQHHITAGLIAVTVLAAIFAFYSTFQLLRANRSVTATGTNPNEAAVSA